MTLFEFDRQFDSECSILCGIDEAGRGPLAGDVYAAAVAFDRQIVIDGINDSKKLSPKKREALYDEIKKQALRFSVATASVSEIDEINILNATMLAMKRVFDGLNLSDVEKSGALALIDGNKSPDLDCRTLTVIHGDALSQSIAAASILAKVSRDRYMEELAVRYPEYRFEKHKGYGTPLHYEMIKKYGVSEVHRRTFLKNLGEK